MVSKESNASRARAMLAEKATRARVPMTTSRMLPSNVAELITSQLSETNRLALLRSMRVPGLQVKVDPYALKNSAYYAERKALASHRVVIPEAVARDFRDLLQLWREKRGGNWGQRSWQNRQLGLRVRFSPHRITVTDLKGLPVAYIEEIENRKYLRKLNSPPNSDSDYSDTNFNRPYNVEVNTVIYLERTASLGEAISQRRLIYLMLRAQVPSRPAHNVTEYVLRVYFSDSETMQKAIIPVDEGLEPRHMFLGVAYAYDKVTYSRLSSQ